MLGLEDGVCCTTDITSPPTPMMMTSEPEAKESVVLVDNVGVGGDVVFSIDGR